MPIAKKISRIPGCLIFLSVGALLLGACGKKEPEIVKTDVTTTDPAQETSVATEDPHLWLEEVLGEESLQWVRTENARTLGVLETDPHSTADTVTSQELPRKLSSESSPSR